MSGQNELLSDILRLRMINVKLVLLSRDYYGFFEFSKAFDEFFLWASFEDKYLEKSVDVSKVTFLAV